MRLAIRLALVTVLVLERAAEAQAPRATALIRGAIALATDTRALTEADAPAGTRTSLSAIARRIENQALRDPCRGIAYVRSTAS